MPAPPRLPAWYQPLTRPRSAAGVRWAIIASTEKPTKLSAMLVTKMIASIKRKLDNPSGTAAVRTVPRELTSVAQRYHWRRLNVVSAIGAHSTLKTLRRVHDRDQLRALLNREAMFGGQIGERDRNESAARAVGHRQDGVDKRMRRSAALRGQTGWWGRQGALSSYRLRAAAASG